MEHAPLAFVTFIVYGTTLPNSAWCETREYQTTQTVYREGYEW